MVREYIGARYVPKFMGAYDVTQSYEALCVVNNGSGTSYITKIPTPAGTPLTDTTHWAVYGASSGAIINLQNQVNALKTGKAYSVDTVSDLLLLDCNDGECAYVKGYYSIDDGGAAFYAISSTASGFNHALNNGLYANIIIESVMMPEQFGAKGDGITDDAPAINAAVSYAPNVIFTKDYLLDTSLTANHFYVDIPSNRRLSGCGTLRISPNNYDNYSILAIANDGSGKGNVIIEGLTIIGDKDTHTSATGQWGFGVSILGSKDVVIRDCKISKCWGDCIYVGRFDTLSDIPDNITIDNNVLDDGRRNNISVVSGTNVMIINNEISNAGGHSPEAGIDIEPDGANDIIDTISIINNIIHDNVKYGVSAITNYYDGSKYNTRNITIQNNEIAANERAIHMRDNVSGETGYASGFIVIDNNIHDCLEALYAHNIKVDIYRNKFLFIGDLTESYVINLDNVNNADIVIESNTFESCRAADGIINVGAGFVYLCKNIIIGCVAESIITFDLNGYIEGNILSSFFNAASKYIISYTGASGNDIQILNNTLVRRSNTAQITFVHSVNDFAMVVSNNVVLGQAFKDITTIVGGNNFFNWTAV